MSQGHIRLRQPTSPHEGPSEPTHAEVMGEGEEEEEIVEFQGDGEERYFDTIQEAKSSVKARQGRQGPHITKQGTPDRRFVGQRDLPAPDLPNPGYKKYTVGKPDEEGIHRTKDGRPDRRFLENRAMSEEDAQVMQANYILTKHNEVHH